jgi:membrane protein implicated in regulation of membrane protease activity
MIAILTWVSIFAGGLLILLFLISLVGGLDIDIDMDSGADAGGIGVIKGMLTFISVSCWVIKVLIVSMESPVLAVGIGIASGVLAFVILSYVFKTLLQYESNVNYSMSDALYESGEVYLKIPNNGSGIVNINVKGATREMKAKSKNKKQISTGAKVMVVEIDGEYAIVEVVN